MNARLFSAALRGVEAGEVEVEVEVNARGADKPIVMTTGLSAPRALTSTSTSRASTPRKAAENNLVIIRTVEICVLNQWLTSEKTAHSPTFLAFLRTRDM